MQLGPRQHLLRSSRFQCLTHRCSKLSHCRFTHIYASIPPRAPLIQSRLGFTRSTPGRHAAVRRTQFSTRNITPPNSVHLHDGAVPFVLSMFDADSIQALIRQTTDLWPRPKRIPEGWSCEWEKWDFLFTLFWRSPYFLRIPQIQMTVNIHYRIPGEIQPIMYSMASPGVFAFMVEGEFFLAHYGEAGAELYGLGPVQGEDELMTEIENATQRKPLSKDPDGEAVIQRILARDESVSTILYEEGYLDYEPAITTIEEEREDLNPFHEKDPTFEPVAADSQEEGTPAELEGREDATLLEEFEQYFQSLQELNPSQEEIDGDPALQQAMQIKAGYQKLKAAEDVREAEEAARLSSLGGQELWADATEEFQEGQQDEGGGGTGIEEVPAGEAAYQAR